MSENKILGIVGSPRRGGNTETLIDQVLRGAEDAGGFAEKIVLSEINVQPCRACNACHNTGKCVIDDDFASTLEKMKENKIWVLGTPVYWWGPTAQMKAFIDRWYGVDRAHFRGKSVILAISSGGGPSYSRLTVEMLESIIPYLGMNHIATLQAPGTSGLGSVKRDKTLMNKAMTIGHDVMNR